MNCASQSSCFLSVNGAVHAVKLDGKCDEAQNDLIRHHGMSVTRLAAQRLLFDVHESAYRLNTEATIHLNRVAYHP